MAKLYYRFSPMNAGKSTALLQVAHNYEERGMNVLLAKPTVDTKGGQRVVSRLGASRAVNLLVTPEADVWAMVERELAGGPVHCLLVDEAQFLTRQQANQLFLIAVELEVPVIAYGLRSDFRTGGFEGSTRLLEIAHAIEELKTICRCGRKAVLNGLKINGRFVRKDPREVIIDDDESVEYEALCGQDYLRLVGPLS